MAKRIIPAIIFTICIVSSLSSCKITAPLARRQDTAHLRHSSKEQREMRARERQRAQEQVRRSSLLGSYATDSATYYIAPLIITEDGERMASMNIDQITVTSRTRTLPERMGSVNIDFVVTLPKTLQGKYQQLEVIPILYKGDQREVLEPLSIRGGLFSKVQKRNYWQYERYVKKHKRASKEDLQRAFDRFVYYPYLDDARLDTVMQDNKTISYFYSQEVSTENIDNNLRLTVGGKVIALDHSSYVLPESDTLTFTISSMLPFIDNTPRYTRERINKPDSPATVNPRSTDGYWNELARLIRDSRQIEHRPEILSLITRYKDREALEAEIMEAYPRDYRYIADNLYPQLPAVDLGLQANAAQDTTTALVPDTLYNEGLRLLEERKYEQALHILFDYKDQNSAVVLLSLGYNESAYDILRKLPKTAVTEYLQAIACARMGRRLDAIDHFDEACLLDENMIYRGNLDPEISALFD